MLIIIEGPDGGGKTRLVNRLRDELPGYLWVLRANGKGRPTEDQILASAEWIDRCPNDITIICDRHPYISELVYGEILRAEVRHPLTTEDIARRLSHALIIYCRPSNRLLAKGVQVEKQFEGVHSNHARLIGYYDRIMAALARSEHGVRVVEYNWEDPRMRPIELVTNFITKDHS